MTVTKTESGKYQARFKHDGKQYKKTLPTSRDAKAWEASRRKSLLENDIGISAKDNRTLAELGRRWQELHGYTLADQGKRATSRIVEASKLMGEPRARNIDGVMISEYRNKRTQAGISANHANHELTYIKSCFNELIRLGEWKGHNPIATVKKLKVPKPHTNYLTREQINDLLTQCDYSRNKHLTMVVKLILSTGSRWGESQNLRREHFKINLVTFTDTKNGDNRSVPIDPTLGQFLDDNAHKIGRMFNECQEAFENAIERAGIELPKGQCTHVLRHTFASHFMMNGGDILTLSKILGHGTIQMTMRYAHLAPEHLEKAVKFNPLMTELK